MNELQYSIKDEKAKRIILEAVKAGINAMENHRYNKRMQETFYIPPSKIMDIKI